MTLFHKRLFFLTLDMNYFKVALLALLSGIIFFSCKKEDEALPPDATGPNNSASTGLLMVFDPQVNNLPFVAGTKWYANSSGDSFTVTKFNYYISNVKLKKKDGTFFIEPESYHLIKQVEGKKTFVLTTIPVGEYTDIEFMIGVDSLRNVSGAQNGDLDPAHQMFWDWNSGYIFYKLEGVFKTQTISGINDYGLHIGLFSPDDTTQKTCKLIFPEPIRITGTNLAQLVLKVKVEEVFDTPRQLGFAAYDQDPGPTTLRRMAENYKDMFEVKEIKN